MDEEGVIKVENCQLLGLFPVNVVGVDVIVNNEPPCWMLLAGSVLFTPPSLRVCWIRSKILPNLIDSGL